MRDLPSSTTRQNALNRFDHYGSERTFQIAVLLLIALMMVFTWGFVQLADFSNRVHVLVFWAFLATYVPMVIGLALLWSHVSRNTRLVLKAIDLATRKVPSEPARAPDPFRAEPDPKSRLWL